MAKGVRHRAFKVQKKCFDVAIETYGGYSNGVPPLPIPNREVKPVSADGTA